MNWDIGTIAIAVLAILGVLSFIVDVVERFRKNKPTIRGLNRKVGGIERDVKSIKFYITKMASKIFPEGSQLIRFDSPPNLTQKGIELAQKSGIDDLIEKHKERWFKELDGLSGYPLFDKCQAIAKQSLVDPANKSVVDEIRNKFYELEGAITIDLAEQVFTIRLRDKYQNYKST